MWLKRVLTTILTVGCGVSALCGWASGDYISCAPQSPVDVVTTYLQAWVNKDWRSMYNLLDASIKEALTLEQFRETFVLRVPLDEQESYFVPARYAKVELQRVDSDTAVVGYVLAFTKEGYMGKRLAQITDEEYRKTASNADRYLMRLQAVRLVAEIHNLRSRYVDVALHVYVAEALQRAASPIWQFLVPDEVKGFYYYITATSDDDTATVKRANEGAYLHITHWGSSAAVSQRAMLLRRTGDRWFITNAVVPLTDPIRSSLVRVFPSEAYGNGVDTAFKHLAQLLGLLD